MAYEKLDLKTGDRFTAENLGYIESALSEVISSDEGKAPQTALDARVPDGLGLRVDTSVGTRLFVGDTMIHGVTGRRNITSIFYDDTEGMITDQGSVFISRTTDLVSLVLYNLKVSEPNSRSLVAQIPLGFRPIQTLNFPGVISGNPGARMSVTPNGTIRIYGLATQVYQDHFFSLVWPTADNWPTTLPGLPA